MLVSGFTVMIAMAGMYFAGAPTFTSFATGTIVVVAVAMLGSLTVLPALLSKLGDRVDKGRVPGLGRLQARVRPRAASGRASSTACCAARCCRPSWPPALLVALAFPALHMHTGDAGHGHAAARSMPVVQTFEHLQKAFPSETSGMSTSSSRPRT